MEGVNKDTIAKYSEVAARLGKYHDSSSWGAEYFNEITRNKDPKTRDRHPFKYRYVWSNRHNKYSRWRYTTTQGAKELLDYWTTSSELVPLELESDKREAERQAKALVRRERAELRARNVQAIMEEIRQQRAQDAFLSWMSKQ